MYCQNCRRDISENSNFCYFCGAHQVAAAQPAMPPRRLMRSATDIKVAGVCGGLAEYSNLDPTIVRLLWALVTFCTGIVPGLVVYLVAWVIMPVAPIYIPAPAASAPSSAQQSAGPA
jgi:phage shock protein C